LGGTRNPNRGEVAKDIVDAILKTRASKDSNEHKPASYWSKELQETFLEEAFQKWAKHGNVWSAAAEKVGSADGQEANLTMIYAQVHQDQLNHVRRGCLARQREDVCVDGSRIEGSHKGWNSLQRSHSSGVLVLTALSHDFVLRRNMRIGTSKSQKSVCDTFTNSTFGSHHIRLVNAVASRWNVLITKHQKTQSGTVLKSLPQLLEVASGETFGAVSSEHTASFGGLLEIKPEPEDDDVVTSINSRAIDNMVDSLKLDPLLLFTPHDGLRDARQLYRQDDVRRGHSSLSFATPHLPSVPASANEDHSDQPSKRSPEDSSNQPLKKARTVSRRRRCYAPVFILFFVTDCTNTKLSPSSLLYTQASKPTCANHYQKRVHCC
jgi:hypothetical protein